MTPCCPCMRAEGKEPWGHCCLQMGSRTAGFGKHSSSCDWSFYTLPLGRARAKWPARTTVIQDCPDSPQWGTRQWCDECQSPNRDRKGLERQYSPEKRNVWAGDIFPHTHTHTPIYSFIHLPIHTSAHPSICPSFLSSFSGLF